MTSTDKAIINPDSHLSLSGDESWQDIVNSLTSELADSDTPDNVIRVTELLLSGYSVSQAAKKAGVSAATVRRWMSFYPTMAAVISDGRKLLSKWRMAKLEQQFLEAIEKNEEILNLSLTGLNPKTGEMVSSKILTVVAAQVRYIIGLFAGQRVDIQVTHELGETTLKARRDALDYIAQQIQSQRDNSDAEPIEAVYRVIDDKYDNSGPLLNSNGEPHFGHFGKIEKDDNNRARCHICGKYYVSLQKHILMAHNMGTPDYETLFMLEEGSIEQTGTKQEEDDNDNSEST